MGYVTNSKGCKIDATFHRKSDFLPLAMKHTERCDFRETISHPLVDVTFWEGRKVCLSIRAHETLSFQRNARHSKTWPNGLTAKTSNK